MTAQNKLFTLEDLNFGGTNYHNMQPKNLWLTWWGDQLIQTDVEECYTIDAKTGKKTKLFTLEDINQWAGSDDDKYVRHLMNATFPYPDKPIVQVGNRKAVILVDFKQQKIVWQDSIAGQTAYDWNPVSKATAYVDDHQLFVVDANGQKHQLSTDGSREIVYGQSVHRNEFGIEKGTFWSPDGQRLAFYRMDQSMVADYPQVDIFPREATYEPDKYPMAGMTSHKVTVGIYDLQSDKTIYLQAGDPTDRYFTNIAWSPDASTVYMFELNREQNDCRLVSYDATTGERKAELYRETSDKYVEPLHPIEFLPWDASKFIMQSQKDGYNHIYLFNKEGQQLKQLTSGQWVVMEVLGFNKKTKSVIIASNEKSPLQRNLYAVSIANGKRTPLDNGRGVHRGSLSDSGILLYDKYQEPTVPRCIDIMNTSKGVSSLLLKAEDPWADYLQPIFENGRIKAADGVTDLYYRMVKPHDFDAMKKYPTVVYVYGGPHAHNVDASWHWASRSWETYMAQKGYIVFILDNRGSENRGRDFEQATFHQLGQIEMLDQMKGVEYLRSLPYVDIDRLGVHGWSFGGFMTISLMLNYPDVFKAGVAGGPVIDWKWYEVMYGERYMGTPENNPEGYAKTSLIDKAKDLKGKLQIITGYNDNTVVPQHCLSFLDACVKAGTQPDFFVYPGEEHNMRGHASVHLHERITQYFEDYLK
jgi:dipeptidyl-peptidase-4